MRYCLPIYGYSAEEAIGRSATIILPPDIIDEENVIIDSVKAGGHVEPHETRGGSTRTAARFIFH